MYNRGNERVIVLNIKEFSNLSKLDPKTLRYYESVGLLKVDRAINGYRVYTEENIKTIKLIKLFRQLDLSIEEIKLYLDEELSLDELKEKARLNLDEKSDLLFKQEMSLKDLEDLDSYIERPIGIDSKDARKEYYENLQPDFKDMINHILYILGPVIVLFLYLYQENVFANKFVLVLNLISVFIFARYLGFWNRVLATKEPFYTLAIIFRIIFWFGNYFSLLFVQEKISYLLLENNKTLILSENSMFISFLMIFVITIFMFSLIKSKFKHRIMFLIIMIAVVSFTIFDKTDLQNDGSLIKHSIFSKSSVLYGIEDIDHYEVKTYGKNIDFIIYIKDTNFKSNISNQSNYDDMILVDTIYKENGIKKISKKIKECKLDKEECILMNKILE